MPHYFKPKRKSRRRSELTSDGDKRNLALNLNPLLSVIINLLPLFLIVLNFKHIVGVKQDHMPEAHYLSSAKEESKKLFDVDIKIYNTMTEVEIKNHKGEVVSEKKFKSIADSDEKTKILAFIETEKNELGHLTVFPKGTKVKFNEIAQAIDISNFKSTKNGERIFKNFSIGNIL